MLSSRVGHRGYLVVVLTGESERLITRNKHPKYASTHRGVGGAIESHVFGRISLFGGIFC